MMKQVSSFNVHQFRIRTKVWRNANYKVYLKKLAINKYVQLNDV